MMKAPYYLGICVFFPLCIYHFWKYKLFFAPGEKATGDMEMGHFGK